VSKHTRQVLSLEWNKVSPNLLAAGFEKARSENAVAIWDVATGSKLLNGLHADAMRPLTEQGVNETAHSLAWVQAKSILVGMNGKHIKLFDLRGMKIWFNYT
jgi:WD40 repeat protein